MKIAFLLFLTQHGPTFWPPKGQNMEFLKQNFNFQSLRKTEIILLPSMWLKDWLTKVKTSKIVTFCYLWPKTFCPNLLQIWCFFNFYSGIYITTTFLLLNVYLMQNMKKTHWNTSFCFFHNIGPTLAQILPRRPRPLYFFWLIFSEIC